MKPRTSRALTRNQTHRLAKRHTRVFGHSENGQALIESLVMLPLLTLILGSLLSALYIAIATPLIDHLVYEASLCLAKQNSRSHCRLRLTKRLDLFPFHRTKRLSLFRSNETANVRLKMSVILWQPQFQTQLSLPLVEKPRW